MGRGEGRVDDNEDTSRKRYDICEKCTLYVINYYREMGVMIEIDGKKDVDDIYEKIKKVIDGTEKD